MFAFRIGNFPFHCSVCMACLPDAPIAHIFKIGRTMEIEEVRARVVPVAFRHFKFQGQEMRHHDFRSFFGERLENPIVMFPKSVGVVFHVVPVSAIEPASRP